MCMCGSFRQIFNPGWITTSCLIKFYQTPRRSLAFLKIFYHFRQVSDFSNLWKNLIHHLEEVAPDSHQISESKINVLKFQPSSSYSNIKKIVWRQINLRKQTHQTFSIKLDELINFLPFTWLIYSNQFVSNKSYYSLVNLTMSRSITLQSSIQS